MEDAKDINIVAWDPTKTDLANMPPELEQAIFYDLMNKAGFINMDDPDVYEKYLMDSIREVVLTSGWAPTKIGYTKDRFQREDPGVVGSTFEYAWAKGSPDYYYGRGAMPQITAEFQKTLDKMNESRPGLPPLVAEQNAALMEIPEMSALYGTPWYMVMTYDMMGRPVDLPADQNPYSSNVFINFDGVAELINDEYEQELINANLRERTIREQRRRVGTIRFAIPGSGLQ